ncbi:MAG: hypothetical protein DRN71_04380 [Candidatus Nanohalarchaeota archaeon]|nr:MAG: hypothetical protein DRN71_04380 [Candidatus Nanohaloarchaeota archaeon]
MGLFGDDKAKKEMDEKFQQIDVVKHQLMDVRGEVKKVSDAQASSGKDKEDIHSALNVLDGDIAEIKDSLDGRNRGFEERLKNIEETVNDLRLLGKLAIENREELDTIMNILKKIAEPEFKEVVIAHDSELDRFKHIEDEIGELKDKEIIVESASSRKGKV